jgi:hypothetical protein
MAPKAADCSTPTFISFQAGCDLITERNLTSLYSMPQLMKWLHQKRVRWTYEGVFGVPRGGRTLEQEAADLWSVLRLVESARVDVDLEENLARKPMVLDASGKPHIYLTVIGIRVCKEDIERELAARHRPVLPIPPPSKLVLAASEAPDSASFAMEAAKPATIEPTPSERAPLDPALTADHSENLDSDSPHYGPAIGPVIEVFKELLKGDRFKNVDEIARLSPADQHKIIKSEFAKQRPPREPADKRTIGRAVEKLKEEMLSK